MDDKGIIWTNCYKKIIRIHHIKCTSINSKEGG